MNTIQTDIREAAASNVALARRQLQVRAKAQLYKNYDRAVKMIDDHIEDAIQVIIDGLSNKDRYYRLQCAQVLLKKAIPDRKVKEITGDGGGPVQVEVADKRTQILNIINILDEIGFDELNRRIDDGSKRIFEIDACTEAGEAPGLAGEAEVDQSGEGPCEDEGSGEGEESSDDPETGQDNT